jgi:hypothetical protein
VAWRFPDWTAVGLAIPSPFLGSAPLGIPLPEHSRLVGLDLTGVGRLSLHDRQITGGDSNPDCQFGVFAPEVSGSLVAGRRLSPCPHLFASHGLSLSESRSQLSGAFSYFTGHFHARRRREIYPLATKIPRYFRYPNFDYPPPRATAYQQRKITVHNLVDNLVGEPDGSKSDE